MRILEVFTPKICEMFVHKHAETIGYAKRITSKKIVSKKMTEFKGK